MYDKKNWEFRPKPWQGMVQQDKSTQMLQPETNHQDNIEMSTSDETRATASSSTSPIKQLPRREIDAYKYPYYLLNFNADLFDKLRRLMMSECGVWIDYLDESKRQLVLESRTGREIEHAQVSGLLNKFMSSHFSRFELDPTDNDAETWHRARDYATQFIDELATTSRRGDEEPNVCLMYRDEPNERFLRVEGEFDLVELVKDAICSQLDAGFNQHHVKFSRLSI